MSAFADSAAADAAALEESEADDVAAADAAARSAKTPVSNSAVRGGGWRGGPLVASSKKLGGAVADLFSTEAQASLDALEIMAAAAATGAPSMTPRAPSLSTTSASNDAPVVARAAPAPPPPSAGALAARAPWALLVTTDIARANAARLAVVWPQISALLRVLARSRAPAVRAYGASALADLAVAHAQAQVKSGAVPAIDPVALLAPLVDFWRSPCVIKALRLARAK